MPRTLPQIVPKLGVDMGSAVTRLWVEGQGVVLEEASCVALNQVTGKLVAVGNQAAALHQRLGDTIRVQWLVQDGIVSDLGAAKQFFESLLSRAIPFRLVGPIVLLSLPSATPEAIESLLVELWHGLGATEVSVIAQPLAAAIGAGVPVAEASGTLVAVLGAGVIEVVGISLGTQVAAQTSLTAGDYLDELLIAELRQQQHFLVSTETARLLKEKVLSIAQPRLPQTVIGKSTLSGAPQELTIKTALLREPGLFLAQTVGELLKTVLRTLNPAVTADIVTKGVLLAGGLSQLNGLDAYLIQRLGIPVAVVEDPSRVVINGVGTVLHHYHEFKQSLGRKVVSQAGL